jgi:hypothetical protein
MPDKLIGNLSGLTRDEFAYILDISTIGWMRDEANYGEYRTKYVVLDAIVELEGFIE